MRKGVLLLTLLLLVPSAVWAQAALKVSSITGSVQWRAVSSPSFRALTGFQPVQVGDEVRTGPDAQLILEVPDGSYMVVSENSKLVVEDFWSGNLRSLMNLMVGKVRFYVQRFGGRPNPYRVTTPTALIAVRGTTFEVTVDEAQIAEVRCLEGRVAVETVGLPNREVILEAGRKTLVRPGEYPLPPVANEAELIKNRIIHVVKKSVPDKDNNGAPSVDVLAQDNDRRNRPTDPLSRGSSTTTTGTDRGKPTLNYPQ
jgi:ferric-dicitrate binding protein FerR (iron transport regulator)